MGIRTAPASDAQLLEKYVNTSFDIIRKAVDNLETIELFGSIDPNSEIVLFLKEILDNIDEITGVINSAELVRIASRDIEKGNYFGNRKTDIDIALNKVGIAETETYEEAQTIWQDTTDTVYYNKIDALFVDGTLIEIPFINDDGQPIQVSTHGSIVDQLRENAAFANKLENASILEEVGGKTGTIIRIVDVPGTNSNLDRLTIYVSTGSAVNAAPIYYWALTTSALQTLAQRIGDIIALGNSIQAIIRLADEVEKLVDIQAVLDELVAIHFELTKLVRLHTSIANLDRLYTSVDNLDRIYTSADNIDRVFTSVDNLDTVFNSISNVDTVSTNIASVNTNATNISSINTLDANILELTAIYNSLTELLAVYTDLTPINTVYSNLADINTVSTNIVAIQNAETDAATASAAAITATDQAEIATVQAGIAVEQAGIATTEVDKIEALSATATTLTPGSSATASYDLGTGVLTLGIPQGIQGIKGDKGDAYTVDSIGLFADRTTYDAALAGYSFVATDLGTIYFKLSNTSGDWSAGYPFGKGDTGDTGPIGPTGNGIASIIRTTGDGSAGTTDIYTITYTDATTSTFNVYNGQDGAAVNDLDINLTETWSSNKIDSEVELKKAEAIETAVAMAIVFG